MLITVSIIEDSEDTRKSLITLLKEEPQVRYLNAYANAEEAIPGVLSEKPDVLLVDINLPGMSGIECVARLKARLPDLRVLMLTKYEESDLIFESLRAGASGYLLKKMLAAELIPAIEQVQAGGAPMSMQIARKVVDHFHRIRQPASDIEKLTPREQEILALLAQGAMYKEIGGTLGISLNTVRMHLKHIYEKLHVQSRTEAALRFVSGK
jgi:DNA-binding NarL/FixJ family response regulator